MSEPLHNPMFFGLVFMLIGGYGLFLSFYIPHRDGFTSDHAIGAAWAGFLWFFANVALACWMFAK